MLKVNTIIPNTNINFSHTDIALIAILVIWELIWKAIALWKSARNDQIGWFVVLAILNSLGILPIIYILFFQKKKF